MKSPGFSFAAPVYDIAADGSIWARGRTYNAHFAADGFTYIPYLGGHAPRNYPVTFAMESVETGGRAMTLAQPTISRSGDRVIIDRGGVTETYDLSADAIKQLFVFNTPLAGDDAKIRLGVRLDMPGARRGEAFAFGNQFGSVSYTDAVAVDSAARRTSAPTPPIEGTVIEISVPASAIAGAKYSLTIDPIDSTFTLGSPEGTGTQDGQSENVFDATSNKWMLVWEENFSASGGDIHCMLCDQIGQPIAGSLATINGDGTNARHPRMANNNIYDKFLIAYEKGAAPARRIWSRWRASSGVPVESELEISTNGFAGDQHSPEVGGVRVQRIVDKPRHHGDVDAVHVGQP